MNWRREYLDGQAAAQINHVEEAVIHGIFITKERVDASKVVEQFKSIYLTSERPEFLRWRQRVVSRCCCWPYWETCAELDESYHFSICKDEMTKASLETHVASLCSEPIDFDRPVWQVKVFENLVDENGESCSAVLMRIHHCMGDGYTLMRVTMQACEPNKPPASLKPAERERRSVSERKQQTCCFQLARYTLQSLRKLLFMLPDKPSVFKAARRVSPTDTRHVAWSSLQQCASVEDLKALGRDMNGASINDIFVTALTRALAKYGEQQPGIATSSRTTVGPPEAIRGACWVALAPLKHIYTDFSEVPLVWGNNSLGACYLKFPLASMSDLESLEQVKEQTADPALPIEAMVGSKLIKLVGWLPRWIGRSIWNTATNNVSLSMSNIPGPQFGLKWCGASISRMLFFVPPTGTVSLFVTIATFDGEIAVGMGGDGSVFDHDALQKISGELFQAEIREMKATVGNRNIV